MTEKRKSPSDRIVKRNPALQTEKGEKALEGYERARGKGRLYLTHSDKTSARRMSRLHGLEQLVDDVAAGRRDDLLEGALENNTNDW